MYLILFYSCVNRLISLVLPHDAVVIGLYPPNRANSVGVGNYIIILTTRFVIFWRDKMDWYNSRELFICLTHRYYV